MINTTDGNHDTNMAHICGEVTEELRLNHKTYGEAFYTFEIGIVRNSGYEDQIIVMVSERILCQADVKKGIVLEIQGQVRTYNEEVDGRNRLNIVVFAREMREVAEDAMPKNEIYLEGYHRPSINHPDDVVYDALISILSEGRSSRLYRSLVRDRQLAIAAQGMSGEPGLKYPTLVLFYAVPAPGHSNEEVAAALHEELDKLIQTPVTEEELNGVKSRVRYALVSSLTTNSGWASLLGNYQGLTGDWRNLFKTIEKIERVTPEDIQRVARETFRPTNRTAVYIETAMQEGSNPVLSKE